MNGDTWRSATCEELAAGFTLLTKDPGPWRSWFNNLFIRIDMHDLVDRGFAEWDGDKAIRFTSKGLWRIFLNNWYMYTRVFECTEGAD